VKWNKFVTLHKNNNWLGNILSVWSDKKTTDIEGIEHLKELVRKNVRYIAFRPIESLHPNMVTMLERTLDKDNRVLGWKATESIVCYAVEGSDKLCFSVCDLSESLIARVAKLKKKFDAENKAITVKRFVQVPMAGSLGKDITDIKLDIYEFPENGWPVSLAKAA
jgi:hypothetical protein